MVTSRVSCISTKNVFCCVFRLYCLEKSMQRISLTHSDSKAISELIIVQRETLSRNSSFVFNIILRETL